MRAGGTLLGSGTFALPANTFDANFYSASFASSTHDFTAGERLQVSFSLPSPAELFWDGAYDFSGVSVPVVTLVPTATPTATVSPTPTNTLLPSATPTNTVVPAAITVNNVTAAEGAGLTFTVTLDNPVAGGFTVNVTLTDATATGGAAPLASPEDYNDVVPAKLRAATTS